MDDLDAVTRDLLAAPFAIDLSDPQSSPPRPDSSDGSPWWTPVLAGAALVALLGGGALLVHECRRDPAPPLAGSATLPGALRVSRPAQGLPLRPLVVEEDGHRLSVALVDVRHEAQACAIVRFEVDGRGRTFAMSPGDVADVGGYRLALVQAYPRARLEDEAADVLLTPVPRGPQLMG